MSDVVAGFQFSNTSPNNIVNAGNLNALVGSAVISGLFYTAKPLQNSMAADDLLLLWGPALNSGAGGFYQIAQNLAFAGPVSQRGITGLVASCTDGANISIAFTSATLRTASGQSLILGTNAGIVINVTGTQTGTLVNGRDVATKFIAATTSTPQWAYFFVISDGTNVYGLVSQSPTAPVVPNGAAGTCNYWALAGVMATDASANPLKFYQTGKEVVWKDLFTAYGAPNTVFDPYTLNGSGVAAVFDSLRPHVTGTNAGFQTVDLTRCVPPSVASKVRLFYGSSGTDARVSIFGSDVEGTLPVADVTTFSGMLLLYPPNADTTASVFGFEQGVVFEIQLTTSQQIWWATPSTGLKALRCLGFTLLL